MIEVPVYIPIEDPVIRSGIVGYIDRQGQFLRFDIPCHSIRFYSELDAGVVSCYRSCDLAINTNVENIDEASFVACDPVGSDFLVRHHADLELHVF